METVNLQKYIKELEENNLLSEVERQALLDEQAKKNENIYHALYVSLMNDGQISSLERDILEDERIKLGLPKITTDKIEITADKEIAVSNKISDSVEKNKRNVSANEVMDILMKELLRMEHYYHHHEDERTEGISDTEFKEIISLLDKIATDQIFMNKINEAIAEREKNGITFEGVPVSDLVQPYINASPRIRFSDREDNIFAVHISDGKKLTVLSELTPEKMKELCRNKIPENAFENNEVYGTVSYVIDENGTESVNTKIEWKDTRIRIEAGPYDRDSGLCDFFSYIQANALKYLRSDSQNEITKNAEPEQIKTWCSQFSDLISHMAEERFNRKVEQSQTVYRDGSTRVSELNINGEEISSTYFKGKSSDNISEILGKESSHYNAFGLRTHYEDYKYPSKSEDRFYDDFGRITHIRNSESDEYTRYDEMGRVTSVTDDKKGVSFHYSYSPDGKTTSLYNDRTGHSKITVRDDNGNVVSESTYNKELRLIAKTENTFDSKGHLLEQINLNGESLYKAKYDSKGNLTEQIAPDSLTRYWYDNAGRMIVSSHIRDGVKITRHFDKDGNETVFETKNRDSVSKTEYKYDRNGRMVQIKDSKGGYVDTKWKDLLRPSERLSNFYTYGPSVIIRATDRIIEQNASISEEKEIKLTGEQFEKELRGLVLQSETNNPYDAVKFLRNSWEKGSHKNQLLDKYFEQNGLDSKDKFDSYFEKILGSKVTAVKKVERKPSAEKKTAGKNRIQKKEPSRSRAKDIEEGLGR